MKPTTRERKKTKVFSTPWMSVSVTMSPFDTCVTSWPSTASTCCRAIDRLGTDRHLGDPLRQEERDERPAEAEDAREPQELAVIDAVREQPAVDAEHADDDREHHHDGEVGGNKQQDAFHGTFLGLL